MCAPKTFAFVLMPFDSTFDDIYRFGIKETASSLGIVAERVNEQIYQEGILERIYRQIETADIVIADMTGKNPNVFMKSAMRMRRTSLRYFLPLMPTTFRSI